MANITQLLAALAELPPAPSVRPITPPFVPQQPDIPVPEFLRFPVPEAPPVAPSASPDQAIIQQFLALAGPAPAPPPAQADPGLLGKIALALQGFGAGVQGQGGQFLQNLREERARPQREFEQRQREFDRTRQQLGLAGLQEARGAEEQRQARVQAQADRQFEIEVADRARRLGIESDEARIKLQDALLTERQDKERQAEEKAQQAKFEQQMKIERGRLRKAFLDQGAGKYAEELARFSLGEIDTLSPQAEKANRTIQAKIARRQGGGGGGRSGGAGGAIQTFAELSDGSILLANAVKPDILPPGVTVKRLFSPQLQPPAPGITPQDVTVTLNNDATAEQRAATIAALRARAKTPEEKAAVEAGIKAANVAGQPKQLTVQEEITRAATPGATTIANVSGAMSDVSRRAATFNSKVDTINWLRNQLRAAQSLLSKASDGARKAELQAQVTDLQSRLRFAESQL